MEEIKTKHDFIVEELNKYLIPAFRFVLIFVMIYAVCFTVVYYKTVTKGNPFIYGATKLQEQTGQPVFCSCSTPKGYLCFNTSFMSAVGSSCLSPERPIKNDFIINLSR